MFGFSPARRSAARPARPAIVRTAPAALEPLESRQLLSGTLAPAATAGLNVLYKSDSLQGSILTNGKVKGTITLSVNNADTAPDKGINTFAVYASTDAILDPTTDLRLATVNRNLNLKSGGTATIAVPVRPVPIATPGNYHILVSATNAIGTVSTVEAPGLMVAAAFVSLQPVLSAPSPVTVTPGKAVTVKVAMTNAGNVNSFGGPLIATIGLSADGASVGTALTQLKKAVTLKGNGKSTPLTYHFVIPKTTPLGTYFLSFSFSQGTATSPTVYTTTPIRIV